MTLCGVFGRLRLLWTDENQWFLTNFSKTGRILYFDTSKNKFKSVVLANAQLHWEPEEQRLLHAEDNYFAQRKVTARISNGLLRWTDTNFKRQAFFQRHNNLPQSGRPRWINSPTNHGLHLPPPPTEANKVVFSSRTQRRITDSRVLQGTKKPENRQQPEHMRHREESHTRALCVRQSKWKGKEVLTTQVRRRSRTTSPRLLIVCNIRHYATLK